MSFKFGHFKEINNKEENAINKETEYNQGHREEMKKEDKQKLEAIKPQFSYKRTDEIRNVESPNPKNKLTR